MYVVFLCRCIKMLKLCLNKETPIKRALIYLCFFNLLVLKYATSLAFAVCYVWENKGKQC